MWILCIINFVYSSCGVPPLVWSAKTKGSVPLHAAKEQNEKGTPLKWSQEIGFDLEVSWYCNIIIKPKGY